MLGVCFAKRCSMTARAPSRHVRPAFSLHRGSTWEATSSRSSLLLMARASNPTPLDFITGTYGTGMYENPAPEQEQHLSPPAKAAVWIGSIATIVGGGALLLSYFWPVPPETLNYKGVVFNISKSGGTWIGSFSYGNQSYSINGSSVNDAIAQVHNQIDSLVEPTSSYAQASSAGS